jgi:hypothetical protein
MEAAVSPQGMRWSDLLVRLRWSSRVAWEAFAWPEFLAVATLGFVLGLSVWVNRPLYREMHDLQASMTTGATLAAGPAPLAASAVPGQGHVHGSEDFVAAFMAFLPATDLREQQMHTLHGVAGGSGVDLSRVEYGHGKLKHLPGQRMTVQLSVRAEYAAYRKFVHNLLVAMPNLSIERVTMERVPGQPAGGAAALNVRIETSLYYRNLGDGRP